LFWFAKQQGIADMLYLSVVLDAYTILATGCLVKFVFFL